MQKIPRPLVLKVMAILSERTLSRLVVEHTSVVTSAVAEPPPPKSKQIRYIFGKNPTWPVKKAAIQHFFDWCHKNRGFKAVEKMRRERHITRGLFAGFVRDNTPLLHHCTQAKKFSTTNQLYINALQRYTSALQFYCDEHPLELDDIHPLSRSDPLALTGGETEVSTSVVAESGGLALTPWAKHSLRQERIGKQYNPHQANLVCKYQRRRQWGAGRPRKCMPFREVFTRWFGSIRFSIDTKIMCRVPISFLLAYARHLYRQYCATSLELEEDPETVDVGPKWIRMWLIEVRMASRMPNRKWKVARLVLGHRCCIYWINVHMWRYWVFLEFGYDPHFRNLDQSPMHKNEAGSKCYGTIALKNQCTVPLLENHASTRERMSLSTVTDSNEDRINNGHLQGFEIMFKADGKKRSTSCKSMRIH